MLVEFGEIDDKAGASCAFGNEEHVREKTGLERDFVYCSFREEILNCI